MILLAVAPNGARKTKADLPAIPLSAEEIGLEARACQQAGASMIHLHVRNSDGKHSLNSELYKSAIQQIKKQTEGDLFIQVTSEAVGKYSSDEQFEMIHRVKPQGVSIGLREIKQHDALEINEHFNWMRDNKVCPQLILYNQHDLELYKKWLEEGVLPGKTYPLLFVIGKHQVEGVFNAELLQTDIELSASSWMVCAFGDQEYSVGKHAAKLGGHIRLGFENNHLLANGNDAKNNTEIIKQMASHLKKEGEKLASYQDACKIMKPDW
jgi:uncharacterized protein (DUF849 family)